MFRFVSSKNPVKLKKAYLAQYNVNLLQKKLDKLMTDYPNIKAALSDDITVKWKDTRRKSTNTLCLCKRGIQLWQPQK